MKETRRAYRPNISLLVINSFVSMLGSFNVVRARKIFSYHDSLSLSALR